MSRLKGYTSNFPTNSLQSCEAMTVCSIVVIGNDTKINSDFKKFTKFQSDMKTMLICFSEVNIEFVPPGRMVDQNFYLDMLRRMHEKIWYMKMISDENTLPTLPSASYNFFQKTIVPHLSYLPDLAQFPVPLYGKKELTGKNCLNVNKVKEKLLQPWTIFLFKNFETFQHWENNWYKHIQTNAEEYIGGEVNFSTLKLL